MTVLTSRQKGLDFRNRLPALDGLRGMAILAVFFQHYAGGLNVSATSTALKLLGVIFSLGWTGVDLFFVLSGFLITGILVDTRSSDSYYRTFYGRRALRIFPIYYLLLLLCVVFTTSLKAHWVPGHLFFLVYLGYPAALFWPSLPYFSPLLQITHVWSLSLEEQFYLAWPWLIQKMATPRRILALAAAAVCAAIVLRSCFSYFHLNPTWSYTLLFCRMDDLALGAMIAILLRGEARERVYRIAPVLTVLGAAAVTLLFALRKTTDHSDPVVSAIGFTCIGASYAGLLIWALRSDSSPQRFFSLPLFRTFGTYSYGLYLFHFPLSTFISPLKVPIIAVCHSVAIGSAVYVVGAIGTNLACAIASYHLIEAPIMSIKSRITYHFIEKAAFASQA